ncbi:hypothetical protein [Clostridium sp. YIM B02551]|uniref:hypothetical protein n=1 Tax=Clostridium sp. YIM B02551 TaxID=2910679 RepID=UPI001EE9BE87|nr:hypothetical protein [Clostridium sp. YIM B02551]
MNKKTKSLEISGICSVFLGMAINRVLSSYFNDNAKVIAMTIIITILMFIVIVLISGKHYVSAIALMSIVVSFILLTIGMYLDNLYLAGIGLGLSLLIIAILAKILPTIVKNKKTF